VICEVWKEEVIPEQLEEGLICPIYKKRRLVTAQQL
jgi:hypothetical protein